MEYRVELDIYNGPLDLLLFLIKRDELDIYDIPIARITDSYMSYLKMIREMSAQHGIDINLAGEFLVMAATLMEIKSALLLPQQTAQTPDGEKSTAEELADPRYELVQKLLEYKRFKDAAAALEEQQELHQQRFARIPARRDGQADEPPPLDLDEVQIWDLLQAFQRLMSEVGGRQPRFHEVVYDDTPIDLHATDIEDRLKRDGRLSFRQLMEGRQSRSEMIGVFLALLELCRQRKILVQTGDGLNDIIIDRATDEHRKAFASASLHLADESPVENPPGEPGPPAGDSEPEAAPE